MKNKPIFIIALVVFFTLMALSAKHYADAVVEKKVAATVDKADKYVRIRYGDVSVGLPLMSVRLTDVTLTAVPSNQPIARIEQCILHDIDTQEEANRKIVSRMELEIRRMALSREVAAAFRPYLNRYGLGDHNLSLDFRMDYDYQFEAKTLTLNLLEINAPGLGSIKISGKTSGTYLDLNHPNASLFGTLWQGALLSATIDYRDDSLISRMVKAMAKAGGKSEKAVIEKMKQMMTGEDEGAYGELSRSAEKFFNSPNRLLITARPEKPILFNRFGNFPPEKLPQLLKLQFAFE